MNCTRCGAPIDLTKSTCGQCGTPLDANGDGVPDALERLIEDKARALIDAKEERAAFEREQAAREEARRKAESERESKRRLLQTARENLERAQCERVPVWRLGKFTAGLALIVSAIVVLPASCVTEHVAGHPIWGDTLCPKVCNDCRGPGRLFSWHTMSGNSQSEESRAICHTPRLDIDHMNWTDFSGGQHPEFELPAMWRYPLSLAIATVIAMLLLPFATAALARKQQRNRVFALEMRIGQLERALGPDESTASSGPFR